MIIRKEKKADERVVETIVREAFWNVYQPGCMEHYILHVLRHDPAYVPELSMVLEEQGQLIGQIAYAKSQIQTPTGPVDVLLFGPVAILPDFQHQGYGEQLIRHTLSLAQKMAYPAVLITGNPAYYSRFGFEPASRYQIYYEGMAPEDPFLPFMIYFLDPEMKGKLSGIYQDPACYFVSEEAVEAFDQQFSPKSKEVRPGQLR